MWVFEQQVMSHRSFISTSGPQWVRFLTEGVLFLLANRVASGSQFYHPPGVGGGVWITQYHVSLNSKSCHVGRSSTLLVHNGLDLLLKENSYFHLQIWPPLAANFLTLWVWEVVLEYPLHVRTLCELKQQVMSRRSFIYTSGPQLVRFRTEGV